MLPSSTFFTSYKPEDFSDVGQAEVLANHFSNELRYSPATHFIRYTEHYWKETEPGAQAVAHELTRRQLKEATKEMQEALKKMEDCGAQTILDGTSKAKAEQLMSDEQLEAYIPGALQPDPDRFPRPGKI